MDCHFKLFVQMLLQYEHNSYPAGSAFATRIQKVQPAYPCSLARLYTVSWLILILMLVTLKSKMDCSKNGRRASTFKKSNLLRVNVTAILRCFCFTLRSWHDLLCKQINIILNSSNIYFTTDTNYVIYFQPLTKYFRYLSVVNITGKHKII